MPRFVIKTFNLRDIERKMIVHALRATRGVKTDAAKALGIGRRTLYDKLREHEIRPEEYGR